MYVTWDRRLDRESFKANRSPDIWGRKLGLPASRHHLKLCRSATDVSPHVLACIVEGGSQKLKHQQLFPSIREYNNIGLNCQSSVFSARANSKLSRVQGCGSSLQKYQAIELGKLRKLCIT